jgi:hypothetical protein
MWKPPARAGLATRKGKAGSRVKRVCTPSEASALLDSLKAEWNKLPEADRLDCLYVLRGVETLTVH